MYCMNCGKKNPNDAKFCSVCGEKLVIDDEFKIDNSEFEFDKAKTEVKNNKAYKTYETNTNSSTNNKTTIYRYFSRKMINANIVVLGLLIFMVIFMSVMFNSNGAAFPARAVIVIPITIVVIIAIYTIYMEVAENKFRDCHKLGKASNATVCDLKTRVNSKSRTITYYVSIKYTINNNKYITKEQEVTEAIYKKLYIGESVEALKYKNVMVLDTSKYMK